MNDRIVKQNMELVATVTRYILQHPNLLDRLPPDFKLVILPDDDPELSRYNLGLLGQRADQEKPVVIVRVMAHQENLESSTQVYVPLAA
jgi:hypothetical protein